MPGLPVPYVRWVMRGRIASVQGWSTSLWLAPLPLSGTMTQADLNAVNSALATASSTHLAAVASACWSAGTQTDDAVSYYYPAGAVKAGLVSTAAAIAHNGAGVSTLPSFCSLVASTRSAVPGRSGRGRNYIPYTQGPLGANYQAVSGTAALLSAAWAALITDLNSTAVASATITGFETSVASFTTGLAPSIVSVIVDSLVDTQHRREDKFVAAENITTAV